MTKRKPIPPVVGKSSKPSRWWRADIPPPVDDGYIQVGRIYVGGENFSLSVPKPKRPARRKRA